MQKIEFTRVNGKNLMWKVVYMEQWQWSIKSKKHTHTQCTHNEKRNAKLMKKQKVVSIALRDDIFGTIILYEKAIYENSIQNSNKNFYLTNFIYVNYFCDQKQTNKAGQLFQKKLKT